MFLSLRFEPLERVSPPRGLILAATLAAPLAACGEQIDHTPLGAAAAAGELEAVRALLDHADADPDAIAEAGWGAAPSCLPALRSRRPPRPGRGRR